MILRNLHLSKGKEIVARLAIYDVVNIEGSERIFGKNYYIVSNDQIDNVKVEDIHLQILEEKPDALTEQKYLQKH